MVTSTTTRLFRDEDIDRVLELMRLALGEPPLKKRTPELFRWKHVDNPFGRSIALVAEEGDRIVGLRTFMRWSLVTPEGDTLRCIRAVDTATHPDFQRRGIFRRLTHEAVDIARDEGVDMIFNTPNSKSRPGYLKMGWQVVGRVGAMIRPSLALLRATKTSKGLDPDHLQPFSLPADTSDSSDRPPRGLRTPRTDRYLEWRFTSHPSATYFAAGDEHGTAVLRPNIRMGRRELILVDLLGSPAVGARAAVGAATDSYLATWFSAGSPERSAVMRRGFIPIPGVTALTLVMKQLRELPASYLSMSAWDLAVSDLELL